MMKVLGFIMLMAGLWFIFGGFAFLFWLSLGSSWWPDIIYFMGAPIVMFVGMGIFSIGVAILAILADLMFPWE